MPTSSSHQYNVDEYSHNYMMQAQDNGIFDDDAVVVNANDCDGGDVQLSDKNDATTTTTTRSQPHDINRPPRRRRKNHHHHLKKRLHMIEFFSGIGGMRLAAENTLESQQQQKQQDADGCCSYYTLESCKAYDISLHANLTYHHNFVWNRNNNRSSNVDTGSVDDVVCTKLIEQLNPMKDLIVMPTKGNNGKTDDHDDVVAPPEEEEEKEKEEDKSIVTLWTMSPPCQPFTKKPNSKHLDSNDKRCNGLKSIIKYLDMLPTQQKPHYILLENVKGFATSHMLHLFKQCLIRNNYTLKEYLLSPIDLGIPNHRLRYYLLCRRLQQCADTGHTKISTTTSPSCSSKIPSNTAMTTTTIHRSLPSHMLNQFYQRQQQQQNGDGQVRRRRRPPTVGEYLIGHDNDHDEAFGHEAFIVPKHVLEKEFAKSLGIVTPDDIETHCFTAGYGRVYHKSTGSILLMMPREGDEQQIEEDTTMSTTDATAAAATATTAELTTEDPSAEGPSSTRIQIDRSNMVQYYGQLRRFMPRELLNLFGFPPQPNYEFPTSTSSVNMDIEHQYKLIGNSINVTVVTELMKELLLHDKTTNTISTDNAETSTDCSDDIIDNDGWQYYSSVDEWMMTTMNNLTKQEEGPQASMHTPLQLEDSNLMATNRRTSPTTAKDNTDETIRGLVFGKGCKGHIIETIHDENLIKLYDYYRWKPLPNCTGRYTCRDHKVVSKLSPIKMLEQAGITTTTTTTTESTMTSIDDSTMPLQEYFFQLPGRNDQVSVVPLDENNTVGVITFVKNNKIDASVEKNDSERGQQTQTESNTDEEQKQQQQQQQQRPISYVHTFNTPSGFRRKLEAIGINVTSNNIWV